MLETWGLLGPEVLSSTRRTRTLELAAAVRRYNELAAPGLAGVWFGKQVALAMLGLVVAERARELGARASNVEVTNAIEALACWLAFRRNGWDGDARLRGRQKLRGRTDWAFSRVRQRGFYVTQPMRMSTVQALSSFGFVEAGSSRFNAFRSTEAGRVFVDACCEGRNPNVAERLTQWVRGKDDRVDTRALMNVLSPVEVLQAPAKGILQAAIVHGRFSSEDDRKRRADAWAWMDRLRPNGGVSDFIGWKNNPGLSEAHWRDLEAGARFFEARDAAIGVLDAVEAQLGPSNGKNALRIGTDTIGHEVQERLESLADSAGRFLQLNHPDHDATPFCAACGGDPIAVLRSLVLRDGVVLRLVDDRIVPGPAYQGPSSGDDASPDEGDNEARISMSIPLPEGISMRIHNLLLLNLDLKGQLDVWMRKVEVA